MDVRKKTTTNNETLPKTHYGSTTTKGDPSQNESLTLTQAVFWSCLTMGSFRLSSLPKRLRHKDLPRVGTTPLVGQFHPPSLRRPVLDVRPFRCETQVTCVGREGEFEQGGLKLRSEARVGENCSNSWRNVGNSASPPGDLNATSLEDSSTGTTRGGRRIPSRTVRRLRRG